MYKAKQKTVSLMVACLTFLVSVVMAFACLFGAPTMNVASAAASYTETAFGEGTFLITTTYEGKTYYLPATTTTSKAPVATAFTDVSEIGEEHLWTVTATGSNFYIQNSEGKYLYTTATNNGVRVSTTQNAWAYNSSENSLKDTKTNRYLGIYNAQDWRCYNSATHDNYKNSGTALVFYMIGSESSCEHVAGEGYTYDSTTNAHYQTCSSCGEEIEGTRTACSTFTYGDYITENGVHTRTATCNLCDGVQTESGTCEISAEYVRNGDEHTQTGTCSICGNTTTVTENCTLTYENAPNNDKTHNMTSTCSVCEQSVTTENVACTFDDGVAEGATVTYTCEYCQYSYSEIATTYTVTYVVPSGIEEVETVEVAENFNTILSTAGTVDGYTFVGWTTAEYTVNTAKPETVYEAGEEFKVTENVTLYALYSFAEGTGAWMLVTDANKLSLNKQIVIVATNSDVALSTTQNGNNRGKAEVTKSNSTITFGDDVQIITLEDGTETGTFAFNVGTGYLYAASSGSNYLRTQTKLDANASWDISITADGVATIKAQGTNTRNWLRENSSSGIFSCYGSGQNDVSIYMKDGAVYYTTEFAACQHENTTETTTKATCTETGLTKVVCDDCGATVSATEIPALGHNYVDNFCDVCGEQDPDSIDYSGYYYISFTHSETLYYVDNSALSSNRYYARTGIQVSVENVDNKYIFRLEKTATGIYSIYEFDGDCYQENVTVEKVDGVYHFYATVDGDACQLLLNAGSETKYVKFYKASNANGSNYAKDITLTAVTPATPETKITDASLTLGKTLTMNYYVTLLDEHAGATMNFTMNGETTVVEGVEADGQYVFSFEIPPQYMATTINAKLIFEDAVIAEKLNYSIKQYAQNQLNNNPSDELKQLLTDLLYYGDAAYNFVNETTGATPVTSGVDNIGEVSTATPATNFALVDNTQINEYPAYFVAAGVWFDNVNKLYVKLNTTENVTLKINNVEVEVTGKTVYTEGIIATDFDETFTFELYYGETLMQTLTYSVNAYATAMNSDALALALYRYGASAEAYAN